MKKARVGIIGLLCLFGILSSFLFGCGREVPADTETPDVTAESDTAETAGLNIPLTTLETEPPETETLPPDTEPVTDPPETEGRIPGFNYDGGGATMPKEGESAPIALMYHLILDEPYSSLESLFVRPSELRGHIEVLLENGYRFIFADEYGMYGEKTVIMSFDDGYVDNYTEMFPIIKEYNVKVTVFMVAGYIGGGEFLSADQIREMSESGLVSFQSHTYNHRSLKGLTEDELAFEFSESNRIIEDITGRPVRALCYPTGAYDESTLSVAKNYYDFAYTTVNRVSTAGADPLALPRLRVSRGRSKTSFSYMIP